jgi:signal transduction histidine kinase
VSSGPASVGSTRTTGSRRVGHTVGMSRRAVLPTEHTILQALAVARWLAWGWLLAVVGFSTDALRHPLVAGALVAATLLITILATFWVRTAPNRLVSPAFALAEVALTCALQFGDGLVYRPGHVFGVSQNLAVQWPLIASLAAAVAFGPRLAAPLGFLMGPARYVGAELNGFHHFSGKHWASFISTSLFYTAIAAVAGWIVVVLRRIETEVAQRRARDDVARVLHDTVLQTLALVQRRVATLDPVLAIEAQRADRELRAYLYGGQAALGAPADDLAGSIRASVERARRGHDLDVTVNVIDDDCRLNQGELAAVAGAIGEAVANAAKHARCQRVVVYAETDDRGHVFASVRDDGIGFDLAAVAPGRGISESIEARVREVDGRTEMVSGPNEGTEVRIWI